MNDAHRKARLRHLIATDYGNSQIELARAAQISKSRLSQMAGEKEPFGEEAARRLAYQLGLDSNWFNSSSLTPREAHGARNVAEPSSGYAPAPGTPVSASSLRRIWAVGKGAGGVMAERIWTDGGYPTGATDMYADLGSSDPNAFLVEVTGFSMHPKYENKNFALIEPNTPVDVEDCVLVRLRTGETMLKRLISRRNGVTLGSFNESELLQYDEGDISWMYYSAHEVPRKKIKSRY